MPVFDLFSARQKKLRGETAEVFVYDTLPVQLRVQIVKIISDGIGSSKEWNSKAERVYEWVFEKLCREHGWFQLVNSHDSTASYQVHNFILKHPNHEEVLDAVELSFLAVGAFCKGDDYRYYAGPSLKPAEAIEELNERFLRAGVGYQFLSEHIVRQDSQYLHTEAVKPALALLSGKRYSGANDEFLRAHEHYRAGLVKECLNECLKAFESTMKAICVKRKWPVDSNATAKTLIEVCLQNGLFPPFLQGHFNAVRALLEGGIPTVRNKLGGHGQGATQVEVPAYFAGFLLHMTASAMVFLIEAEQNLK